MGIFDRFRRKKQDDSVLPAEVNEYYQSEQRGRRGVAILLGIITLVVTLLIAAALFFAGRWVFHKITDDKDKKPTSQTASNKDKQGAGQQTDPSKGPSSGSTTTDPSPNPAPTPAPDTSTPSSSSPNANTPATGDEPAPGSLPRTGDEGM